MAKTIAHPDVPSYGQVLANAGQLLRLMEKAGVSREAMQRPIDDPAFRQERADYWERGGNPGASPAAPTEPTTTPAEAAHIMGRGFHGIGEVEQHFGVKLSAKQRNALEVVPFSAEVLTACRDTHILVAGAPLSIMDIQGKAGTSFYFKNDPWYARERFARTKVRVGWYLIAKGPVPNSTAKTYAEQQALLASEEATPGANVMVQAIQLHYLATKERLLPNIYVSTTVVGSDGRRVIVGYFDAGGLSVYDWSGHRYDDVGVASSRKFS